MGDHIVLTPHLTREPKHEALARTFIGQAHIAGTGPAGATCRECRYWHDPHKKNTVEIIWLRYAASNKTKAGELKRHLCRYRIPNKADRRIPHNAQACRFFDRNPKPPEAKI